MTYYDSSKGLEIDHKRVIQEMKRHGIDYAEHDAFFEEVKPNERGMWKASEVLEWLGY